MIIDQILGISLISRIISYDTKFIQNLTTMCKILCINLTKTVQNLCNQMRLEIFLEAK